jgi:hypothetical protein
MNVGPEVDERDGHSAEEIEDDLFNRNSATDGR